MPTPRTVHGQAWLSGTRPHVRRALEQTIVDIEDEAVAPYAEALREADRLLESLAAMDPTTTWSESSRVDLVKEAEATHQVVKQLLG
jgi:hypothetical protein